MRKFNLTLEMMKSSWELLKLDKELLVFPIISGLCCLLVMFSFIYPILTGPEMKMIQSGEKQIDQVKYFFIMFLFYFFTYLVIIFFNSAVVACAIKRLEGGDPDLKYGFNAAMAMLPVIVVWALISATVGMILRMIEERSDLLTQIVAGALGLLWSVVSFLVIPILVVEKKGPIAALKESTYLLKKTWGQQLIGRFSFGIVFMVLGIPAYLLIFMSFSMIQKNSAGAFVVVGLAFIYLLILGLVQSVLQAIFQAVIYNHVKGKQTPQGFNPQMIRGAFGRNKPGISFGRF